jgi:hypothetical protein
MTVTGNFLRGNNTLNDGSPEMLLQYYVHDTTISHNTVISTNADAVLLYRDAPAGGAAKNARVVLDHNRYEGRAAAAGRELYFWNGAQQRGLKAYQAVSGQDRSSSYTHLRHR